MVPYSPISNVCCPGSKPKYIFVYHYTDAWGICEKDSQKLEYRLLLTMVFDFKTRKPLNLKDFSIYDAN